MCDYTRRGPSLFSLTVGTAPRTQAFVFDATGPEGSSARKLILRNSLWHFELTLPGLVQQR